MFEAGLWSAMKANVTELSGVDNNGTTEYKLYYIDCFDPMPPPYATFCRTNRGHEMDLVSKTHQYNSQYIIEIYHNDSWLLLALQQKIRTLLETFPLTTVGSTYIQQLEVTDDYHEPLKPIDEVKLRIFKGVLTFDMFYNPS